MLCRVSRTPPATTIPATAAVRRLGAADHFLLPLLNTHRRLSSAASALSPGQLGRAGVSTALFHLLSAAAGVGVSVWSARMFTILPPPPRRAPGLQRWPAVGGLVQVLHGLEELPEPSEMERLPEWRRLYRSAGAWYVWRLGETKEAAWQ